MKGVSRETIWKMIYFIPNFVNNLFVFQQLENGFLNQHYFFWCEILHCWDFIILIFLKKEYFILIFLFWKKKKKPKEERYFESVLVNVCFWLL